MTHVSDIYNVHRNIGKQLWLTDRPSGANLPVVYSTSNYPNWRLLQTNNISGVTKSVLSWASFRFYFMGNHLTGPVDNRDGVSIGDGETTYVGSTSSLTLSSGSVIWVIAPSQEYLPEFKFIILEWLQALFSLTNIYCISCMNTHTFYQFVKYMYYFWYFLFLILITRNMELPIRIISTYKRVCRIPSGELTFNSFNYQNR